MTRGNSAQGGHNHPRAQADQASQDSAQDSAEDSAQDSAQALAQQFFVTFVYVADAGRGLQPQDVQAWHAWVARARGIDLLTPDAVANWSSDQARSCRIRFTR